MKAAASAQKVKGKKGNDAKKSEGGKKAAPETRKEFPCDICEVTCPTEEMYQEHIKGKKHRKREEEKKAEELAPPPPAEEPDIMDTPLVFSGWMDKGKKKGEEESSLVFERRWFEVRGSYLVYFMEKGAPTKGVIHLASTSVDVQNLTNPEPVEDSDSEGDGLDEALGLTPLEADLQVKSAPRKLDVEKGPPGREYCLILSGGCLLKDLVLSVPDEESQSLWHYHISNAIETANEKDRAAEIADIKDESVHSQIVFDYHDVDGTSSPVTVRSPKAGAKPQYRRPLLQDFELLAVVGRGSYGKVLKVRRKTNNKIYAMKVIAKESVVKEKIVDKVKHERSSLSNVHHPFLSPLHYAFQTPDKLYLVMDFYGGGDLRFHLRSRQRFKEPMAAFYTAQLTLALDYLHSRSILYRDLKPGNVVLGEDGYAVLTDFGMARKVESLRARSFCGTDLYMAPEMINEKEYGVGVDWWSLGIVTYEMLVGKVPFYSDDPLVVYNMVTGRREPQYPSFLSPAAVSFLQMLLHKDEAERCCDAESIKSHEFLAGIDTTRLLAKELQPPFLPDLSKSDTRYFDTKYTQLKPTLTRCRPVPKRQEEEFRGFSYPRLSVS